MMHVAFQDNAHDFLTRCGAYLQQNEAEHNLILSLCQTAQQRTTRGEKVDMRFSALFDNDNVVLAAVQTPPHNLVLSKAGGADIAGLAEQLISNNFNFPGIVGPAEVITTFSEKWTELTGQKSVEYMDQIIYTLKKVTMPARETEGKMRWAREDEAEKLAEWICSFAKEAMTKAEHLCDKSGLARTKELIKSQSLAVWAVDDKPVSIATATGTDNIARIGTVYTPADLRGKGYASAIVAHLSQLQLDQGKQMCCLYADARNTVSNSIYRKIGYEFVGRSSHYVLEPKV